MILLYVVLYAEGHRSCVEAEIFAYIPWSVMRFEYPKGYANAFAPFCSDGFCCIPVTTNFAYLFAYPLPASRF